MTTLEAVNEILTSAGLFRVTVLQTDQPSAAGEAEAILDEICRREENQPYFPMERKEETLSPELYEFEDATWTASSKRITLAGAFTDASVGQAISLTAPTTLTITTTTVTAIDSTSGNFIDVEDEIYASNLGAVVAGAATSNRIYVETGTVTVRGAGADAWRKITQNGGYLYDHDNTTSQFTADVVTERTVLLAFSCVPEPIASSISAEAACEFIARWPGADKRLYRARLEVADRRKAEAMQYHARQSRTSNTDSPSMRRMLGGRHGNAFPLA